MFFILTALGVFGTLAVIPYSSAMNTTIEMTPKMRIAGIIQGVVMAAVAVFVGLLAAWPLGLQVVTPVRALSLPAVFGIAAGIAVILIELGIFFPRLPEALTSTNLAHRLPLWKRFLAAFYGGITEELLMRFFLLSGLLWVGTRIWHTPDGGPMFAVFMVINIFVAVIFGLGHLPAVKMLTSITPLLVVRAVILNGVAGVVFGLVYWRYGLAAAMVSHFCADIILHVVSPYLTKVLKLVPA